ncbi:MAG: 3-deoxy-7-phosphoheptulonate synthase [Bacteroidota bacterium]|jgi:chorismate mutase
MYEKPFLIAGPCSAETENQVFETAKSLLNIHPDYFRAGIWKPRTRPSEFEGVGNVGLNWLRKVKTELGLKVATEVAKPEHVEAALDAQIDMLWIGARTTTNPFSVQELAEALTGVNVPIMVKNPVNPDLKLWIGAIERFSKRGIQSISAIHRGFSVYEKTLYRNNPNWQIPIDLMHEMPDLKLICDPSHIGGRREILYDIAQKAMDLKYHGLMLETHYNPTEAWTDAKQQVDAKGLYDLLNKLKIRNHREIEEAVIKEYRAQLHAMDEDLIQLLRERMKISEEIGNFKKEHNLAVLQSSQWEETLKKNVNKAVESSLSEDFSTALFKLIHEESIHIQSEILNPEKNRETN